MAEMNLALKRMWFTSKSTGGILEIDGEFECFTLEDKDRELEKGGEKIPGQTAIPRGKYRVIVNFSRRFGRALPLLLNVPQFEGIRIHAGNTDRDTEGCILVGKSAMADYLGQSKLALEALLLKIFTALDEKKEIWISIS